MPDATAELGRLRWRCRRGMKELDVLLCRYLEREYPVADGGNRAAFERLLTLQDPLLHAYLTGSLDPPDPETRYVVGCINGTATRA
jgi:antitoxin CptB